MSAPTTNIPVAIPAGAPSGAPQGHQRTIAGSLATPRSVAAGLLHGTPGRMRLYGLFGVIAAVLLGAVSANALLASQAAVERAANNTNQVVLAQSIHVDLLRADAVATNAFLVGGLESAASRKAYDDSMARVAQNLSQAAAAQPADGRALGELSKRVQTYAALVEQARANNRLGLPVGAQYLKQASAGLRSDAIPIITAVVTANEGRSKQEFDRSNSSLQLLVGVVALIGLVVLAVWMARRTHRYLNPSLTGAVALLLVALFFAATQITTVGNATRDVQRGDYRQAVTLATVTTAANDARANESLTLISRGSGAANEKAWKADRAVVDQNLRDLVSRATLEGLWSRYVTAHEQVRQLDDDGGWDAAVKQSTSTAANGAAAAYTAFDAKVAGERDDAAKSAAATLEGTAGSAGVWATLVALAALVASWLVVRGIGQRIEEYR